ncbi:hypothetical protein H2136_22990 [Aeromonas hydrophila]|uniref:Uncharacterized protein n=1 Tax=Aeromonas hydrophila TaxID=644 RepID=A0A926FMJ4_AERHY|nr:hypothetical protein [Aeromonas hydrophila]
MYPVKQGIGVAKKSLAAREPWQPGPDAFQGARTRAAHHQGEGSAGQQLAGSACTPSRAGTTATDKGPSCSTSVAAECLFLSRTDDGLMTGRIVILQHLTRRAGAEIHMATFMPNLRGPVNLCPKSSQEENVIPEKKTLSGQTLFLDHKKYPKLVYIARRKLLNHED